MVGELYELYALASPNERSVRILVFLEAAHQRLLAARSVLNNQMNRCPSIYKGGSADCHFSVCNTTLGLQYGAQRGLAGAMWKVECFRFFLSCGKAVICPHWSRCLSLNLFFLQCVYYHYQLRRSKVHIAL